MTRTIPVALAVAALVAMAAPAAVASPTASAAPDGSVPAEVAEYVADGSLVSRLDDVYGPDADGDGVEFDDTTETGAIVRVFGWTSALLAGEETEHPVEMRNEWVVPIAIAGEPAGLAVIWINPRTVLPELAEFTADPDLAAALSDVPDGAALVRDDVSRAWLALDPDGVVTPLVPGSTGLSTPVPLDDVALAAPASAEPVAGADPNTGLGLAIGVVVVLLLVVVAALVLPSVRRPRDADSVAGGPDDDGPSADPTAVAAESGSDAPADEAPAAADAAAAEDAPTAGSAPATPISKPRASKPSSSGPSSRSAKPTAGKPPASKPSSRPPRKPKPPTDGD